MKILLEVTSLTLTAGQCVAIFPGATLASATSCECVPGLVRSIEVQAYAAIPILAEVYDPRQMAEFTNGMRDGKLVVATSLTSPVAFGSVPQGGVRTSAATVPTDISAGTKVYSQPANAQQGGSSVDAPMTLLPDAECAAGMIVVLRNPHGATSTGAFDLRITIDFEPRVYA